MSKGKVKEKGAKSKRKVSKGKVKEKKEKGAEGRSRRNGKKKEENLDSRRKRDRPISVVERKLRKVAREEINKKEGTKVADLENRSQAAHLRVLRGLREVVSRSSERY